jgi:hypothetical protein
MLQIKDWREQLRKIKLPEVTELRNEKEIVRAIQYVEEELRAHIQLSETDTSGKVLILQGLHDIVKNIGIGQTGKELSKSIDGLITTIDDINQSTSDLIAGAEAQMIEYGIELKEIRESGNSFSTKISLPEIDLDLKRRREEWVVVAETQEKFENEKDELERQLNDSGLTKTNKLELERMLSGLEKTIGSIIEAIAENDREVTLLESYKNFIVNGLPDDIIGKKLNFRRNI